MIWVATATMTTVMLAAMGWLRSGLRGEMNTIAEGLRGEMSTLGEGLRGEMAGVRDEMGRMDRRLARIEDVVLRDHGQRIARLEERIGS